MRTRRLNGAAAIRSRWNSQDYSVEGGTIPSIPTTNELIAWVLSHADALEADLSWVPGTGSSGGWWEASSPELKSVVRARATSALEFLDCYAGPDSQWSIRAERVFDSKGENQSMESGARALADVLRAWTAQVEAGITTPRLVEAQGARMVASTDLME